MTPPLLQLEGLASPALESAWMDRLEQCGHAQGWSAMQLHQMQLVVEEWMQNLLTHALRPDASLQTQLRLEEHADTCRLMLSDNGPAFDPLAGPAPRLDRDLYELEPGGWGLHLMRSIPSASHYERLNGLNCLTLEFKK